MAIKKLTSVYQTEDGKIHATEEEALRHAAITEMLHAIRCACIDATYDTYGATTKGMYDRRLAEELVKRGFKYEKRGIL